MFTAFYRIIKHGFEHLWRQRVLSMATLVVIILTLFTFESLIIGNNIFTAALNSIQNKIDISVYFKPDTPEDQILNIQKSLEDMPQVKNVSYISQDQALKTFEANHKNDPTITQALNQLGANPLSASLNIQAKDPSNYAGIANYLNSDSVKPLVENVSYNQNQQVIDRLARIINISREAGIILTLVLAFIAVLVAFNTIMLAIYSNKEEIEIMRLVGASNAFIRGPYVVEGVVYGIVAAIVGLIIITPLVFLSSPYLDVFIPGLNLRGYFLSSLALLLIYDVLFGGFIGGLSSFIAIRRYLKK